MQRIDTALLCVLCASGVAFSGRIDGEAKNTNAFCPRDSFRANYPRLINKFTTCALIGWAVGGFGALLNMTRVL